MAVAEFRTIPSPQDPAEALAAVVALRRLADRLERAAVTRALEHGWTWAEIANVITLNRSHAPIAISAHRHHRRPGVGRRGLSGAGRLPGLRNLSRSEETSGARSQSNSRGRDRYTL